jgi:uncharacterized membrane protein HdeD (DUF308 family)
MKKAILAEVLMLLCTLILGVCLVIWADKVTTVVSILLGCIAIFYGIAAFVNYFGNDEKIMADRMQFVFGIVVLVIGFILIFKVDFLKELVSYIIGIYILLTSIIKLKECISLRKELKIKMTGALVLSILGIVIGIMCIVGKFIISDMIVKYIGIMLIIYSVISIIELILVKRR